MPTYKYFTAKVKRSKVRKDQQMAKLISVIENIVTHPIFSMV